LELAESRHIVPEWTTHRGAVCGQGWADPVLSAQDTSRKLFWPNIVMAVSAESYPRFIKSGFNDYQGLGIKRAIVIAMHVPLLA
jgi:hypothetical protein